MIARVPVEIFRRDSPLNVRHDRDTTVSPSGTARAQVSASVMTAIAIVHAAGAIPVVLVRARWYRRRVRTGMMDSGMMRRVVDEAPGHDSEGDHKSQQGRLHEPSLPRAK